MHFLTTSLLTLALIMCQAHAAPNEEAYGKSAGYPVGDASNWYRQDRLVGSYSNLDRIFRTRDVRAAGPVRTLPVAAKAADWPEIRDYLDRHPATGLLIMKDGRILAEHYQYGRTAEHLLTSFSMAKTLVSMAVGVAVAEGRIASIEDPVDKYEPALASSGWRGISIRHVLNMASGVAFDETYDTPNSDIAYLSRAWVVGTGRLLPTLQLFGASEAAPGTRFKYISADTQVLGQVLVKATGRSVADYVGEKIWTPMGAEADGKWVVDDVGMEAAYCCFNARLRDWARLGQMLLDEGTVDGRQVIPSQWVRQATTVREVDGHLAPKRATPYFGYGFQTWIFPDNLGFALLGVRGQSVFVNPKQRVVMVQTAVWTASSSADLGRARDQMWRAVLRRTATMD